MYFHKDKLTPGEDEKIISAYQRGDTSRIEIIIRKYEQTIFRICFRQCLSKLGYRHAKLQAEDLAQEVWRKVFQNTVKFKPDASFKAWLLVITQNTIRDWFRKAYLREEIPAASDVGEDYSNFDFWEKHAVNTTDDDIEANTIRKTMVDALRKCKNELDSTSQKMLDMFLVEKSQRDMAESFQLSLGAVNKRVKTIYRQLSVCIRNFGWTMEDFSESF